MGLNNEFPQSGQIGKVSNYRGGSMDMGILGCSPGPRGYKGPPSPIEEHSNLESSASCSENVYANL